MTVSFGPSEYGRRVGLAFRLRNVGTLQSHTSGNDSWGAPTAQTWSDVDTAFRFDIKEVGGTEVAQNGQQIATKSVTLMTRYRNDVTVSPQMRVVYDGRSLNIVGVADPDGGRKYLVLQCVEAGD